jgi:hypothetical protein
MEFIKDKLKVALVTLGGLVLIIMLFSTVYSSGENKRLKGAIKANNKIIQDLESKKAPLLQKIEEASIEIIKKDSIIFTLKIKEESLKNNIKVFKNEKIKIENIYNNSDISERVRVFSKLATGTDSLQ